MKQNLDLLNFTSEGRKRPYKSKFMSKLGVIKYAYMEYKMIRVTDDYTFEEREESAVVENASSKKQKTVKVKDDKDLFEPSPRESIMAVSARLDKEFKPIIFDDSMISQNSATELDMKVEEILQNSDQGWSCSICGIISSKKTAVKRHIEAKHVTGFSHLCVFCGKTYATRHSLRSHKTGCKKEYFVHGSGH